MPKLEFIRRAANTIFIGPTGVGKTGLTSGLLPKALQNGYRGLFIKAQDLLDEMYASLADRKNLRRLPLRLERAAYDVAGFRDWPGRCKTPEVPVGMFAPLPTLWHFNGAGIGFSQRSQQPTLGTDVYEDVPAAVARRVRKDTRCGRSARWWTKS